MKDFFVNLDNLGTFDRNCVIAIGMFDGIHKGHQKVIAKAKSLAKKYNAVPCVLTFTPHPSKVINMGREPVEMLCTSIQRVQMFKDVGIKKIFVKKFTKQFAKMSPLHFAELLKQKFPNLKGIVTGYNFLFGKNASGNTETLRELADVNGWEYSAVDGVFLSDGRRISSSEMRKAVHSGNLDEYKLLKGDYYTCFGNIKRGKRLGRTIGFPTLNLPWNPDCKLPYGAYIVELIRCKTGEIFKGIASYGTSPTIGETEPLLEIHLFKNVKWGAPSKVVVKLKKFLRPQKKFDSLEALIEQLHKDIKLAKAK
ncbi:MAG: riboflavin biosynthesis protein RibF [Opitutales bacterium]|nr:riboflavin biosynthesis protein RibF [Opitutales bacterium]